MKRTATFLIVMALFFVAQANFPVYSQGQQEQSPYIKLEILLNPKIEGERGQLKILNPEVGSMAHCFEVESGQKGYPPAYFVIHQIKESINESTDTWYTVNRLKRGYAKAWNPQFSPDGRYVLFKYGNSYSFDGPFELFVFDTKTQILKQVTYEKLAYDQVSWSPDGNYIAFIKNGNALGDTSTIRGDEVYDLGSLALTICNWRTGVQYHVASNNSLRGPLNWAPPHSLIYGMKELDKVSYKEPEKDSKPPSIVDADTSRPNIYEYSIETGQSRLLFKDGFRPTPSPSGTAIVFFGSENLKNLVPLRSGWNDYPAGVALSIAKRNGDSRKALNLESGVYPSVVWLPDEKHFVTVKQTQFGKSNRAQVKLWDIETHKFRLLAELSADDFKPIPRTITDPSFLPLHISSDGKTLFVAVTEVISRDPLLPKGVLLLTRTTIKAIDLESGNSRSIAQVIGDSGVDWFSKTVKNVE